MRSSAAAKLSERPLASRSDAPPSRCGSTIGTATSTGRWRAVSDHREIKARLSSAQPVEEIADRDLIWEAMNEAEADFYEAEEVAAEAQREARAACRVMDAAEARWNDLRRRWEDGEEQAE